MSSPARLRKVAASDPRVEIVARALHATQTIEFGRNLLSIQRFKAPARVVLAALDDAASGTGQSNG